MRYQPTKIDIFFIITKHWVEILLFFTPLASVMSFYGMFPPWFIVLLSMVYCASPHGLLCFSPWFVVLLPMVYGVPPPWFIVLFPMVCCASPHGLLCFSSCRPVSLFYEPRSSFLYVVMMLHDDNCLIGNICTVP